MCKIENSQWIELLISALKLMLQIDNPLNATITQSKHSNDYYSFENDSGVNYHRLSVNSPDKQNLIEYDFIPWQMPVAMVSRY